ncbi:MAG TPA: cysteine hydrolase [Alphaproteobacteria bacterium]|jgi:ureidoacrylate peracid hydrolase|nr:cysteine hydrolase [Alphaproteobacteria bacterium]
MHRVEIRKEIVDRVLARRGRYHLFDRLDPAKTAVVIIDMQSTFCEPGAPAEVPASRGIIDNINRFNDELRRLGARVIWVNHANVHSDAQSDWSQFFDRFVADDVRQKTIESLSPEAIGQKVWRELTVDPRDLHVMKNRYSALIPGASQLERVLRSFGIENLLIAGTKTNVCCESTARDAMMLDFNVVMVSDCLAALSDDEHRAALETFIQQFGDVMSSDEVLAALRARRN